MVSWAPTYLSSGGKGGEREREGLFSDEHGLGRRLGAHKPGKKRATGCAGWVVMKAVASRREKARVVLRCPACRVAPQRTCDIMQDLQEAAAIQHTHAAHAST